jgi:hypothetical protein
MPENRAKSVKSKASDQEGSRCDSRIHSKTQSEGMETPNPIRSGFARSEELASRPMPRNSPWYNKTRITKLAFSQDILASFVFTCILLVYKIPQSLESAMYLSRTACWICRVALAANC